MCMFCAAVPVVGAVGAKINADQNRTGTRKNNFPKGLILTVTLGVVIVLLITSVIYHTYFWLGKYG
jgi:hypothetical protein